MYPGIRHFAMGCPSSLPAGGKTAALSRHNPSTWLLLHRLMVMPESIYTAQNPRVPRHRAGAGQRADAAPRERASEECSLLMKKSCRQSIETDKLSTQPAAMPARAPQEAGHTVRARKVPIQNHGRARLFHCYAHPMCVCVPRTAGVLRSFPTCRTLARRCPLDDVALGLATRRGPSQCPVQFQSWHAVGGLSVSSIREAGSRSCSLKR